jgi:hypothetical protein
MPHSGDPEISNVQNVYASSQGCIKAKEYYTAVIVSYHFQTSQLKTQTLNLN